MGNDFQPCMRINRPGLLASIFMASDPNTTAARFAEGDRGVKRSLRPKGREGGRTVGECLQAFESEGTGSGRVFWRAYHAPWLPARN